MTRDVGGRTRNLKIVSDVIKDTARTVGGRQGARYGSDLSKQKVFIGCCPCVLHLEVT